MTTAPYPERVRREVAPERPFDLKVTVAGRAVVARVRGPLDLHFTPRLTEGLDAFIASANRVVVNLRSSEYVDSTGIRALLMMQKSLESARGELRLVVQPGSRVERVIRLLQLERHLSMFESESEALSSEPMMEARHTLT